MESYAAAIMRQYVNSEKLLSLIETFNQSVGPDKFIEDFYELVWNIQTATTYGLNVWGKIVVIDRTLTVTENKVYLGFKQALSHPPVVDDPQPFNQTPFYVRDSNVTSTVTLTDDAYRKLIMCKAMANISNCTIPAMNRMLMFMFGESGVCYVRNDGDMTMSYVFEFELSTVELAIVQSSGALPAPAGVTVNIIQVSSSS